MIMNKPLVAAATKPLILAILKRGENYGYQIIQEVRDISAEDISWSEPMLYPFLQRMEKDGLIKSKWKVVDNKRFRRYYRLTDLGLAELEEERAQWFRVQAVFSRLLEE
ncbi:MAG: helix-turn-helix transcriptional regulator [Acidobacteriota bacterium]